MRFTIVTLFPEMFESVLSASLLGKALESGAIEVAFVDPREFTHDRHRTADDAPYGGGPGMVMKAEPVLAAIDAAADRGRERGWGQPHRLLMSPRGRPLDHATVRELAGLEHIVLVCGRYEGIDERVSELAIDREISVGDFVVTGGELPAMMVVDAVSRFVPGVLGDAQSAEEESFSTASLEYPHYTRPQSVRGLDVPEVLVSGDHERIRRWRAQQSLATTAERRPDLLRRVTIDEEGLDLWSRSMRRWSDRAYVVLAHHPVYDNAGEVVTSSITNMDLHDLARSVATYGLAGYFVVTPVTSQREKVERIVSRWHEPGALDHRKLALANVRAAASLEDVYEAVARDHEGRRPAVIATSARRGARGTVGFDELYRVRAADEAPTCLVFGTGWGLAQPVVDSADALLEPIWGHCDSNHLCVRSAAAIVLDRLFAAGGGAMAIDRP